MKRIANKKLSALSAVPAHDEVAAVDFASDLDEATRHARAIFDVLGVASCADLDVEKETLNALAEIGVDCINRIDDARVALWASRVKT